jgi:hypothetical protein
LDYAFDEIRGGEGPEDQGSQKCKLQREVSLKGKWYVIGRWAYSFSGGHRCEGYAGEQGILALPILRPL